MIGEQYKEIAELLNLLLNSGKTLEYLKRRDNAKVVGNPLRYDFGKISRRTISRFR